MLPYQVATRSQQVQVSAGAAVWEAPRGGRIARRGVEQAQPAAGPDTVLGQEARVVGAGGLFQEEPAILAVGLREESVVAERGSQQPGQDLRVHGALEQRSRFRSEERR